MINKVVVSSGKVKICKAVNLYNNGMYSQSIEIDYGLMGKGVYRFRFKPILHLIHLRVILNP